MFVAPSTHRALQTSAQHVDIDALADVLCDLTLLLPPGPPRRNMVAYKEIAQRMDAAIKEALGAPQGQAMQALHLMQTLTGEQISDAQMCDATQLQNDHSDLRLAIGKVSLFYHQALPVAVAASPRQDHATPASRTPVYTSPALAMRLDSAASTTSRASQPVATALRRGLSITSPAASHAIARDSEPSSVAPTPPLAPSPPLPHPSLAPAPLVQVRTPGLSPGAPADAALICSQSLSQSASLDSWATASPGAASVRSTSPSPQATLSTPAQIGRGAGAVVSLMPRVMADALPQTQLVPLSLALSKVVFDRGTRFAEENDPYPFVCPQTHKLWANPYVDLRTGNTYEKHLIPQSIADALCVPNKRVSRFVKTYVQHQGASPMVLATQLLAALPHTQSGAVVTDPVLSQIGHTYSAAELFEKVQKDQVPKALGPQWRTQLFCPNKLLVALMGQFNLGVPADAPPQLPARLWAEPVSLHTGRMLRQSTYALEDDEGCAEQHNAVMELGFGSGAYDEMVALKPQLLRVQRAYEATMLACNGADYSAAFNAGLDFESLINDMTDLTEQCQFLTTRRGLLLWRSDCHRLRDDYGSAQADLKAIVDARAESGSEVWGRLALLFAIEGHCEEALQYAEHSLNINAYDQEALAARGKALADMGDAEQARAMYALSNDGRTPLREVLTWHALLSEA